MTPLHRSRYKAGAGADYSHRFHAGNVGDVWKHCALVAILRRTSRDAPVTYIDTHAGEGAYGLGPTGEWTEGIGRLLAGSAGAEAPAALADYLTLVRSLAPASESPTRYPGSPLFARAVLGNGAQMLLWERNAEAFARLAAHTGNAARTTLACADGLTALADAVRSAAANGHAVVALIDPPWSQKPDWITIPRALAAAVSQAPSACFVLWYPVKSLTRPNAMLAMLRAAGVPCTVAELITTPLGQRRNRLNGSAVLIVRPPAGALEALVAAGLAIGARCATDAGQWSLRVVGGQVQFPLRGNWT